jgi:ABC-type transport system involved in multi-copper enzyme maturation permease subunit
MAWMIPIIANKKGCRSSPRSVIIGLIVLLVLGIAMFLFFNRLGPFNFSSPIIIWIIGIAVFFMVIIGIGAVAATMSTKYKAPSGTMVYRYRTQKQPNYPNPYTVKDSNYKQGEKPGFRESEKRSPEMEIDNFCRYCGAERDREAKFCYQCGGKF